MANRATRTIRMDDVGQNTMSSISTSEGGVQTRDLGLARRAFSSVTVLGVHGDGSVASEEGLQVPANPDYIRTLIRGLEEMASQVERDQKALAQVDGAEGVRQILLQRALEEPDLRAGLRFLGFGGKVKNLALAAGEPKRWWLRLEFTERTPAGGSGDHVVCHIPTDRFGRAEWNQPFPVQALRLHHYHNYDRDPGRTFVTPRDLVEYIVHHARCTELERAVRQEAAANAEANAGLDAQAEGDAPAPR